MILRALVLCVSLVIISGCAPLRVDLSDSEYVPKASDTKKVSSFSIINRAGDTPLVRDFFGDFLLPVKTEITFPATLESDLNLLLAQTLKIDNEAEKKVFITIRKAEVYRVMDVVERIPFVGLATVGSDKEFFINVTMSLETRSNGKIVDSHLIDEKISILGKAATQEDIAESYAKLIFAYRSKILSKIQDDFINII